MAAVRRAAKGISGGHGKGAEPPGVGRFIVKGWVRLRSANDNAPIHGGREALWVAGQGSRMKVCDPMLGVVSETSGFPDALLKPAKDGTSAQTVGLF